ncbi:MULTISPECIES: hypothetical protein [unclassified Caballeronia]|uniref:hypothetical protein n=1 Tax=unclassified Caballeronia TaxID=2646786 RepID=UPI0020279CCD|nr:MULTISPECIES: hypothetical protein [unclassified Caballeronia]
MNSKKKTTKHQNILRSAVDIWEERPRKQSTAGGGRNRENQNYELGIPIAEGEYASPTECVLMCGFLVFHAKHADDDVRQFARRVLDVVFAAAAEKGFRRADLLETMMSKREPSPRMRVLAGQATAAIGTNLAFARVVARAGVSAGGKQ